MLEKLEKNKDYIEFSMRSMMATHRPYQDDTEIDITGLCPGRDLLAMPFDIPCDVVVVPKRSFERFQASVAFHEKQDEEYHNFLKTLFPDAAEETIEKLIWTTKHIFGCGDLRHNLQVDLEYYRAISSAQAKTLHSWKEATGCSTPEEAKELIDESEACYNHLLALTGFGSEGEIEDALDQCDHSTLRKALVDYEFDYEELLKLTGYKSNQDIRVLLHGDKRQYYHMRDLINTLKRNSEFSEAKWKAATGCDTPGRAEEKLEYYKKRLEEV